MSTQQARTWSCPKCPATFSEKKDRKKHKREAHPTVCPECQAKFTRKKRFKQHWGQNHTPSPCGDCGLTLKGQTALDVHLRNHHLRPGSDNNCVKQGLERASSASQENEAQSVQNNLARETPTQSPVARFVCRECDANFDDENPLRDHWNAAHTARYRCMECNQGWSNFSYKQLKKHQEACELVPLNSTECLKCGTAFRTRAGVVYHLPQCESTEAAHDQRRAPEELATFNCTKCTTKFTNPSALEEHVRALHTVEYRCCDCNSSWKKYKTFREHLKVCKPVPSEPFQIDGSPGHLTIQAPPDSDINERLLSIQNPCTEATKPIYKCGGCEKTATTIPELDKHQLRCIGSAKKCRECKIIFGKRTRFARHLEVCRLVPPNILHCETCGSKFKSRFSLISHRHHCPFSVPPSRPQTTDSYSPKECPTCSMRFSTESALESHQTYLHLAYNFCCLKCAHKFPDRTSLQEHRRYCDRVALGMMNCPGCGQGFVKRSEVVAHAAQCETDVGPRNTDTTETGLAFRCTLCRVTFANEGAAKSHGRFCKLVPPGTEACPCCRRTLATRSDLVSHLFECEGEAPLRLSFCFCNKCEASFTNLNALGTHWGTHQGTSRQKDLYQEKHRCEACDITFQGSDAFQKHASHCKTVPLDARDCPACGCRVKSRLQLVIHLTTGKICPGSLKGMARGMEPGTPCTDCGVRFSKQKLLEKHRDKVHTEYRCCDCDIKFAGKKSLKTHLKSCQLVPRDVVHCQDCGLGNFKNCQGVVSHLVSGKCKPVSCLGSPAGCTRKFKKFEHMVMHLESGACRSKLNRHKIHELITNHDRKNNLTIPGTLEVNRTIAETSTRTPLLDSSDFHSPPTALQAQCRVVDETDTGEDKTGGVILTPTSSVSASPTGIPTPIDTSALPSPTGVLTPASTTAEDSPLLRLLFDPKTCPQCGKSFSTEQSARNQAASPVHGIPRYKCPSDLFFTMLGVEGLKAPGHEKVFKTLSGLVGHLERGGCRDGIDWKEMVGEVLKRVKGGEVKLLAGAV